MASKSLLADFKRPKSIVFAYGDTGDNYAKFMAYPFERGYGVTIGNSLRRILLSSIEGYAISAIQVTSRNKEGAAHILASEFELIPGVVEDTPDVIDNLKKLRVQLAGGMRQKVIHVKVNGATTLTGATLEVDNDVKIINKDWHILTLMEDGDLELEIQIDQGRGYVPTEMNAKYINTSHAIPIDAIFSPVRRVSFSIENTRVGQRTDYDKLILEVWTDGTISPEDALSEAAMIAKEHFSVFINLDIDETESNDEEGGDIEQLNKFLQMPVDELELSVRSSNCLKNANILTVGDLTSRTESEIANVRNFGKKSLQEIKQKLSEWKLHLGTTDYDGLRDRLKLKEEQKETPADET